MERKKLLSTFICVFLGILTTNFMSYVINSLEPTAFVKQHALLLLVVLSAILAILTLIISGEGKELLSVGKSVATGFLGIISGRGKELLSVGKSVATGFLGIVLFLMYFAIFFVGPISFTISNRSVIFPVNGPYPQVRLAQKYCDAIKKQDYSQAYSYGDALSIQATNPSLPNEGTYVKKARLADQAGSVKNCVVGKETLVRDDSRYDAPFSSYISLEYVLDIKVTRENQLSYLVHLNIHVSDVFPHGYIDGISRI